jgi:serralysin
MAQVTGTSGNDSLVGGAENDTLLGLAGTDTLIGNAGNDRLDGGAGIDTMQGGAGDDTYVATSGDVITDSAGVDSVLSDVSWSLGATSNVENLTLTGTAAITANGNNLNNVLTGNDANNSSINGRAGNDTMFGMGGNDTFDMSTGGTASYGNDVIDGGSGTDTVDFGANARSAVIVNLALGAMSGGGDAGAGSATLTSIENFVGGAFADHVTGSNVQNFLFGGAGDDFLDGGGENDTLQGGDGNDTLNGGFMSDSLTGGAGADAFVFAHVPGTTNGDRITDFASGLDEIRLDSDVMGQLGASGDFAAGDARFWSAAGATGGHDADDRVVYNTTTGQLFYDADGSGSGAAQLIFTLQAGAALAATDIVVLG